MTSWPSGRNKSGKRSRQRCGSGQPVHQIDEQRRVEAPQVGAQIASVADLKMHAAPVHIRRHPGLHGVVSRPSIGSAIRQGAVVAESVRRRHEPAEKSIPTPPGNAVPARNWTGPRRSPDRAPARPRATRRDPRIPSPRAPQNPTPRKGRKHTAKPPRPPVMKQQVFRQQPVGLVRVSEHQDFSRSSR